MIAGWFSGLVLSVCCQILRFARVSQCSLSLLVASLPCPDSGFGPEWVPRCQLWYNSNITWSPSVWRSKWHGTWLLTWLAALHGVYVCASHGHYWSDHIDMVTIMINGMGYGDGQCYREKLCRNNKTEVQSTGGKLISTLIHYCRMKTLPFICNMT